MPTLLLIVAVNAAQVTVIPDPPHPALQLIVSQTVLLDWLQVRPLWEEMLGVRFYKLKERESRARHRGLDRYNFILGCEGDSDIGFGGGVIFIFGSVSGHKKFYLNFEFLHKLKYSIKKPSSPE